MLDDAKLIKAIIDQGIRLQHDLEDIKSRKVDRKLSNLQRIWQDFEKDISAIAKANDPNADADERIRTEEAYLTSKLEYLEKKKAQSRRTTLSAELASHGEIPGGIWTAMSKEKKPRDMIHRLKIPKTNPPQYECNTRRMADLARKYHNELQLNDLENRNQHEFDTNIAPILNKIHKDQILKEPEATKMYEQITEMQVDEAIHLSKNGSVTGMDGCPYELWKPSENDTAKTPKETNKHST